MSAIITDAIAQVLSWIIFAIWVVAIVAVAFGVLVVLVLDVMLNKVNSWKTQQPAETEAKPKKEKITKIKV